MMDQQIQWMLANGGLEFAAGRCAASAATIYNWADGHQYATPYVKDSVARSTVTATIDFDERVDAAKLASALRANGIVDSEPYRKLGRNQLRVALFPAIEPADVATLTRAIDWLVERMAG
jgi:phosphoserine aminotransferase